MVVITLIDCPTTLRGDLTKWLLEINAGVFVGNIDARVRDSLWQRIQASIKNGRATMVFSAKNEQRLDFRVAGSEWEPIDFDGLKLILRPSPARLEKMGKPRFGFSKASQYLRNRRQFVTPSTAVNPNTYVVIDIETTGLSPEKDSILEISAVKVMDGEPDRSFTHLIQHEKSIPANITELTGITDQMIQNNGIELSKGLVEFIEFIGKSTVVAHNAEFDLAFLNAACKRVGLMAIENKYIDTLVLSRAKMRHVRTHTLKAMAEYFQIETEYAHRGLSDCSMTKHLYEKLIKLP